MKKLLFLFLIIPMFAVAQDSTVVENLQLKAGTIKLLVGMALKSQDTSMLKTFLAWNVEFKANSPSDNTNVTIASALTTDVVRMYQSLLQLPAGLTEVQDFLGDFKTSIQPKRNTNSYLDDLCTGLETVYAGVINKMLISGGLLANIQ